MNKRKRFNISNSLNKGFEETISIVENDEKLYRNTTIPISRIKPDPDNPRKLLLCPDEIVGGGQNIDLRDKAKKAEFDTISALSESIKNSGLIQPIVVYKNIEDYTIIAGERRYLACLLANKLEVEARIYQKKPHTLELKLIQWFENNEREDLSLYERIENIKSISESLPKSNRSKKVTVNTLKDVVKLSKSQAASYAAVINGPEDVLEAIKKGGLNSLDKAAVIASVESKPKRLEAIKQCEQGISLSQLRAHLSSNKALKQAKNPSSKQQTSPKVNLGYTSNTNVLKLIFDSVSALPDFTHLKQELNSVDWNDATNASKGFSKLVKLLELNYSN